MPVDVDTKLELTQLIRDAIRELGRCRGVWLYSTVSGQLDRAEYESILKMLAEQGLILFSRTEFDTLVWQGQVVPLALGGDRPPLLRRTIATEAERLEYRGYFLSKTAAQRAWVVEQRMRSGNFVQVWDCETRDEAVAWIECRTNRKAPPLNFLHYRRERSERVNELTSTERVQAAAAYYVRSTEE